jgi:hypothetical protein
VLYLDQCTKQSIEYTTQTAMKIQQGILSQSGHGHSSTRRSRTKSISRTSSIPSIGKLFNSSTSRSRSASPSKRSKSHQPQPIATKRVPIHHSWTGPTTNTPINVSQYETYGQSTSTLDSSQWSCRQEEEDNDQQKDLSLVMVSLYNSRLFHHAY